MMPRCLFVSSYNFRVIERDRGIIYCVGFFGGFVVGDFVAVLKILFKICLLRVVLYKLNDNIVNKRFKYQI